jgi:phenylpyruvate tautomerase PptA (4-oxalocrotonate tautomerase family)
VQKQLATLSMTNKVIHVTVAILKLLTHFSHIHRLKEKLKQKYAYKVTELLATSFSKGNRSIENPLKIQLKNGELLK